jgi:hypothetical protein
MTRSALLALFLIGVAFAAGCDTGNGLGSDAHPRKFSFHVSRKSADTVVAIGRKLEGLDLDCDLGRVSAKGRVTCTAVLFNVIEGSLQWEVNYPFGRSNASTLPAAVILRGGSQAFQRALFESLEGRAPDLRERVAPTRELPGYDVVSRRLYLDPDKQGEEVTDFEVYCRHSFVPFYARGSASAPEEYSCITLVFGSAFRD